MGYCLNSFAQYGSLSEMEDKCVWRSFGNSGGSKSHQELQKLGREKGIRAINSYQIFRFKFLGVFGKNSQSAAKSFGNNGGGGYQRVLRISERMCCLVMLL